jgi:hypothetical protein
MRHRPRLPRRWLADLVRIGWSTGLRLVMHSCRWLGRNDDRGRLICGGRLLNWRLGVWRMLLVLLRMLRRQQDGHCAVQAMRRPTVVGIHIKDSINIETAQQTYSVGERSRWWLAIGLRFRIGQDGQHRLPVRVDRNIRPRFILIVQVHLDLVVVKVPRVRVIEVPRIGLVLVPGRPGLDVWCCD